MFATQLPLLGRLAIFLAAGIGAGIANGVAGGGTFITFPTLIATGISPLQAKSCRRPLASCPVISGESPDFVERYAIIELF